MISVYSFILHSFVLGNRLYLIHSFVVASPFYLLFLFELQYKRGLV